MNQKTFGKDAAHSKAKYFFLITTICFLGLNVFAETGQYDYYPPGIDFNLNIRLYDINGLPDTDFSGDCNITSKYLPTSTLVLDKNNMLHDSIILGNFYLTIPASNTTQWLRGKYTTFADCKDYNISGATDISFIIDYETNQLINDANSYLGQLILDSNAQGKGLSSDQNRLLYDINKNIQGLYDTNAPIIVFNYPKNGTTTSSNLVKISFYDYSFLTDINIQLNGLDSLDFNQQNDCYYWDSNKSCQYTDRNFVLDSWNDLNVIVTDDKGNVSYADSNFYYTTSTPIVLVGTNIYAAQPYLFSPVKLVDFNFFIESLTENGFTLHSFSKAVGLTSFDYNLFVYNIDTNTAPAFYSGTINVGEGEQKNFVEVGVFPSHYYLDLVLSSNGTVFEVTKQGYNFGFFSFFVNLLIGSAPIGFVNGVPISFGDAFVSGLFVFIVVFLVWRSRKSEAKGLIRQTT